MTDERTATRPDRGRRNAASVAAASLLVAGIVERVAWLLNTRTTLQLDTETHHVAVALATTGAFSDAFRPGSGPTAHLSPAMPWLMSLCYRVAGVERSQLLLALAAIALVSLSFLFAFLLFRRLGAPLAACLGGLAAAALLPLQFGLEVRDLSTWEAPLAVATLFGLLLWIVTLDARPDLRWTALLPPIVVAALLVMLSPPVALAVLAALAALTVRRLPRRAWPLVGGAALVVTLVVNLPWALRNERVMGRLIWTRSNPGFELALAYNDTLLNGRDQRAAYLARHAEISPNNPDGRGYAALRAAGGELAYYDERGTEAKAWMLSHPGGTVRLLLRHAAQYMVPPAWFFDTWGAPRAKGVAIRRAFMALSLLIALAGLPVLIHRDRRYIYVAIAVVLVVGPYIVAQPVLRYRYLVSTLAIFVAADIGVRTVRSLAAVRRRPA